MSLLLFMYFVYILFSEKCDRYYIGYSNDVNGIYYFHLNIINMYTPIQAFWDAIKGKYKAAILIYLNERSLRYSQIRKKFSAASERILIKQLKELEKCGLLEKKISGSKPPLKSEYKISDYGRSICPILKQIWAWGETHAKITISTGR